MQERHSHRTSIAPAGYQIHTACLDSSFVHFANMATRLRLEQNSHLALDSTSTVIVSATLRALTCNLNYQVSYPLPGVGYSANSYLVPERLPFPSVHRHEVNA